MPTTDYDLVFDGEDDYIEIADDADFSVATTGQLTVSASIRPDVLTFPVSQSTGYVHWMGKGEAGRYEWTFRMFNENTTDVPPRPNRISFYVFNPDRGRGIGSHFQDSVQVGEWIHVVGTADGESTSIYKNGEFRRCDRYNGTGQGPCHNYPADQWITPTRGTAPLRIGTRDRESFFLGAIRDVRIWRRALTGPEVSALHGGEVPLDGLVAESARSGYGLGQRGSAQRLYRGGHLGRVVTCLFVRFLEDGTWAGDTGRGVRRVAHQGASGSWWPWPRLCPELGTQDLAEVR